MSADDNELRRMLALYRQERSPAAPVHDRVWTAVAAKVAPGGGGPESGEGSAPPTAAPAAPWLGKALVVAALLATGGATWLLWPTNAAPRVSTPPVAASAPPAPAPTLAPTPTLTPTPTPALASTPALTPTPTPALTPLRPPASTLALELALLTKAQSAIDGGRFASALRTLRRHAERFPNGALTEEREAASVEALCQLGRAREARSAADAFAKRFPASPRMARVSSLCGAEPTP